MHKKPLTTTEETGLIVQGLGRDIGKPSMAADIFRAGVAWGLMSELERMEDIQKQIDNGMPIDDCLRGRLSELLTGIIQNADKSD